MIEHNFSKLVTMATNVVNGQYGAFNVKKWEFVKPLNKAAHDSLEYEYVSYILITFSYY